jgi:uncharacterized protein YggE
MALSNKRLQTNLSIDLRIVCILLLTVMAVMLLIWKPWQSNSANSRTIQVTGETIIKDAPDEFIFYPAYLYKHTDKATASDGAQKKGEEVTDKLKELGVPERKIKLNVDGHMSSRFQEDATEEYVYTAQLTVTIDNREFAQKIQDYLITTDPEGSITPQGTFSDSKRQDIERKARDEATKDARSKAEQSAANLGFKIGKVKSVEDGAGFNQPIPLIERGMGATDSAKPLTLQPGENEVPYSVTVTYFIQ